MTNPYHVPRTVLECVLRAGVQPTDSTAFQGTIPPVFLKDQIAYGRKNTNRDGEVIQLQITTSVVSSQMEALGICWGENSVVLCFNRQFHSKHLQEAKPFFPPKLRRPLFIQLCHHFFHKKLEAVVGIWALLSRFVFLINILDSLILYLKVKEMIWEHRKQNVILPVLT